MSKKTSNDEESSVNEKAVWRRNQSMKIWRQWQWRSNGNGIEIGGAWRRREMAAAAGVESGGGGGGSITAAAHIMKRISVALASGGGSVANGLA
jgi:hypothetical protein